MRLLEIRDDPLAHFMPTRTTANGTFLCAAPPGLAPELQELFMRPVQPLTGPKRRPSQEPPESPTKRRRTEGSVAPEDEGVDVDDLEQGRRESRAPSVALGSEAFGGRASVGPGFDFGDQSGPVDDFQMDVPEFEMDAGIGMDPEHRARSKSVLSELSRLSTPAPENAPLEEGEETYADAKCPIAIFDDRGSSQSQDTATQASTDDGKGYSKHTVQALGIIRRELQPAPDSDEPKVMSFKKMSDKVRVSHRPHAPLAYHLSRHLVALHPHSSSSYSSSAHEIASSSLNLVLSRISK